MVAVIGGCLLTGGYGSAHRGGRRCAALRGRAAGHHAGRLGRAVVPGPARRPAAGRAAGQRRRPAPAQGGAAVVSEPAPPAAPRPGVQVPELELRGLTVRYGSVAALCRVNAALPAGEITCVLGENGSGKSTLVSVLSGLRQARRGPAARSPASRCTSGRRSRRGPRASPRCGRTSPSPRCCRSGGTSSSARSRPRRLAAAPARRRAGPRDHRARDGAGGGDRPRPRPARQHPGGRCAAEPGDRPRPALRLPGRWSSTSPPRR